MIRILVDGVGKNLSPITQTVGKSKAGNRNISLCRKSTFFAPNQEGRYVVSLVPTVSGNTMRSLLRKNTAFYIFEQMAGVKVDYHTLVAMFQGGSGLVKDTASPLVEKLRYIEKIKQNNVVLSLFGASMGGTMTPGKAAIHDIIPVCNETLKAGVVPVNKFPLEAYESVWASKLIQIIQNVRMDVMKTSTALELASEEAIGKMQQEDADALKSRAIRKATKKGARNKNGESEEALSEDLSEDMTDDPKTQSRQMIFSYEALVPSDLYHHMFFRKPTDIEIGALVAALRKFSENPYIAGRSSVGNGQISVRYDFTKIENGKREPLGTASIDGYGDFSMDKHLPEYLGKFDAYVNSTSLEQLSVQGL